MIFNEKETAIIISEIEKQYFARNFGSLSKSEWEVFLFSIYLAHCRQSDDGCFDDYTLSKKLGITQNRIRSLKEKVSVRFSDDNTSWKDAFIHLIPHAVYDANTHTVKMLIKEKDVLIEVRQFLESLHRFDERSLNDKLLLIPIDAFLEVCFALYHEEGSVFDSTAEEWLLNLKKKYENEDVSALERLMNNWSLNGLKEFSKEAGKELLAAVLEDIQPKGIKGGLFKVLLNLVGIIKKS